MGMCVSVRVRLSSVCSECVSFENIEWCHTSKKYSQVIETALSSNQY